jgi:hypothetical protein
MFRFESREVYPVRVRLSLLLGGLGLLDRSLSLLLGGLGALVCVLNLLLCGLCLLGSRLRALIGRLSFLVGVLDSQVHDITHTLNAVAT